MIIPVINNLFSGFKQAVTFRQLPRSGYFYPCRFPLLLHHFNGRDNNFHLIPEHFGPFFSPRCPLQHGNRASFSDNIAFSICPGQKCFGRF